MEEPRSAQPTESNEPEDTALEAAWERIEDWLMDNAPFTLLTLNEGASERDIWAAQSAFGFNLPPEMAQAWRIHNGQADGTLIDDGQLLPLDQMAAAWREQTGELAGRYLPLVAGGEGGGTYFDTESGKVFTGLPSGAPRYAIRASLADWLAYFADALEREEYFWSDEDDGLMLLRRGATDW